MNNDQDLNVTEKMQPHFIFQFNSILGGEMLLPTTSMQTDYQNLHLNVIPQFVMNNKDALNATKTMVPLSILQFNGILGDAMLLPATLQHQHRWRSRRDACY